MWWKKIHVGAGCVALALAMSVPGTEGQACLQAAFGFELEGDNHAWGLAASLSRTGELMISTIPYPLPIGARLIESKTGATVRRFPGLARFSPAGDSLAVATSSWFSIQRLGQMSSEPISLRYPTEWPDAPSLIGFSLDGQFLLARHYGDAGSQTLVLWRVTDQQILVKHRLEGVVDFGAMSTSARLVAWNEAGSNTLRITNIETGKTVQRLRTGRVHPEFSSWHRVGFIPGDRQLAALHRDYVFRIWNIKSGRALFEQDLHEPGSKGYIVREFLKIDPLGYYAATTSPATGLNRSRLILWDLAKRKKVFEAYGTPCRVIGFSGDGKSLAVWERVQKDDGSSRDFCRFYRVEDMVACGSR